MDILIFRHVVYSQAYSTFKSTAYVQTYSTYSVILHTFSHTTYIRTYGTRLDRTQSDMRHTFNN